MRFEQGLSDAELADLEATFAFRIPPDLRFLLQCALPAGDLFPDWRGSKEQLQKVLSWPSVGILFDVEHDGFWAPSWGARPTNLDSALAKAREILTEAPALIPICSHRYIPTEPEASGNPILSVYQTDIILYGNDLPSYFHKEFRVPLPGWAASSPCPIPFWDELVWLNDERTDV